MPGRDWAPEPSACNTRNCTPELHPFPRQTQRNWVKVPLKMPKMFCNTLDFFSRRISTDWKGQKVWNALRGTTFKRCVCNFLLVRCTQPFFFWPIIVYNCWLFFYHHHINPEYSMYTYLFIKLCTWNCLSPNVLGFFSHSNPSLRSNSSEIFLAKWTWPDLTACSFSILSLIVFPSPPCIGSFYQILHYKLSEYKDLAYILLCKD